MSEYIDVTCVRCGGDTIVFMDQITDPSGKTTICLICGGDSGLTIAQWQRFPSFTPASWPCWDLIHRN